MQPQNLGGAAHHHKLGAQFLVAVRPVGLVFRVKFVPEISAWRVEDGDAVGRLVGLRHAQKPPGDRHELQDGSDWSAVSVPIAGIRMPCAVGNARRINQQEVRLRHQICRHALRFIIALICP